MRRDQLPRHKTATYVLSGWKVVYVAVNKAACTSLKWLVADLQGENGRRFYRSLSREISRPMTVHRRPMWQQTPMLHDLSDEELGSISPDQDWFIFAVTRHPSERLWSAWQSKLLLREPSWAEKYGDASWFPRIPARTEDVVEDFQRFVRSIDEDPGQLIMRNRHLKPQSYLLTPDRTPYTEIYDTQELPRLLEDLTAHLRGQGWSGSLELTRSNETPLRPLPSMFSPEVKAAIGRIYGEDFERFGYAKVEPDTFETANEYSELAIREIGRLVERSERIGDLALRAQRQKRELSELRRQLGKSRAAPPASARKRAGRLARAVRRQKRNLAQRLESETLVGGVGRRVLRKMSRLRKRGRSFPRSSTAS
jgi:hypothetical protein